ncbi:hypothetical protein NKH77_40180 [Streptomyces sp. M19]
MTRTPAAGRVRPRLPGPYERIEALGAEPPEPGSPRRRARPRPGAGTAAGRVAVGRTGDSYRALRASPRGAGAARDDPVRPVAAVRPCRRGLAFPARRIGAGRARTGGRAGRPVRAARRGRRGRRAAAWPARHARSAGRGAPSAAADAVPRAADATAAREAVRAATARRGGRAAERVVHVRIGRLEVSAAGGEPRPRARGPERDGAVRRPR